MLGVEVLVVDEGPRLGLATQVLLGQRRALVGMLGLVPDYDDPAHEALAPQGLGSLRSGESPTGDDVRLLRAHIVSSRGTATTSRRRRLGRNSVMRDWRPPFPVFLPPALEPTVSRKTRRIGVAKEAWEQTRESNPSGSPLMVERLLGSTAGGDLPDRRCGPLLRAGVPPTI